MFSSPYRLVVVQYTRQSSLCGIRGVEKPINSGKYAIFLVSLLSNYNDLNSGSFSNVLFAVGVVLIGLYLVQRTSDFEAQEYR